MLFYDNFERICKERGTTPSGAVTAIGKNKTTAGNWKRNNTIPQEEILVDLADYLKCDVSDFFKLKNVDSRGQDFMDFYMNLMLSPENEMSSAQKELRDAMKIVNSGWKELPGLDDYAQDFLVIYERLDRRDKLSLMNMVYEFADEHGVEL